MSRMPIKLSTGALLLAALGVSAPAALAQTTSHVRVVNGPAPLQRWLHGPPTEVLVQVETGTMLEVLDEETGWFWVVAPPDVHGTRKPGWIRATSVEPVKAAALTSPDRRADPQPLARDSAAANGSSASPPLEADKVSITERRDESASPASDTAGAKAYAFDDLHFDRDLAVVRPQDMETLRAAASALKADPSLVVNIAGYTCNLGTTAHNRALGISRANAVKAYLVGEGIAADRLHTLSLGEADAKHDNAHEDTRMLNRRVTLAVDGRR